MFLQFFLLSNLSLLDKGYTQARICRLLGLKKQKVSYWENTPIKTEI